MNKFPEIVVKLLAKAKKLPVNVRKFLESKEKLFVNMEKLSVKTIFSRQKMPFAKSFLMKNGLAPMVSLNKLIVYQANCLKAE